MGLAAATPLYASTPLPAAAIRAAVDHDLSADSNAAAAGSPLAVFRVLNAIGLPCAS
jgi:hypothetical protein